MTAIAQSQIFFFISSIGFIVLGILGTVLVVLLIKAAYSFLRILTRIESSLDSIGDATKDLIEELRDNVFFRMIFRPGRKSRTRLPK
ncbi:MAG: hypothetical protein WCT02_04895 [Candidatus Paceibacterota bacterium]